MIVLDASAVVDYVVTSTRDAGLGRRIADDGDLHAPHLVDVEVVHALRGLVARGDVSADRAADAKVDAAELPINRYPHVALLERAWELRDTLSIYDGVYVALAEMLEVPLVTCDARLARASHGVQVDVYGVS